MKIARIISIAVAASALIFTCTACQKEDNPASSYKETVRMMDELNATKSIDEDIDFMFLGPDGLLETGYKSFLKSISDETLYPELNGKSYFFLSTIGRYANEILSLSVYFQELDKCGAGTMIEPVCVSFGAMCSNDSGNFTDRYSGKIIVKELTDKQITLRFVKVKGSITFGEFILNGDMTFDIS